MARRFRFLKRGWGFFLIGVLACSSKAPQFNTQFNQLQLNMTTAQVQSLLGPPDLREVKPLAATAPTTAAPAVSPTPQPGAPFVESWHYNQDDGRVVLFEGGVVVGFGRSGVVDAPAASGSAEAAPVLDKGIGETCRLDRECKSQNCHFHTCSGKDNCQVKIGGVCAHDSDCCDARCDFGICRKK